MSNRAIRGKDRKKRRVPVDRSRLNMGNSYSSPPEYYYDIEVTCVACGAAEIWTASQQKWWYEDIGAYYFATAVRCRACRAAERQRKREARVRAGHEPER